MEEKRNETLLTPCPELADATVLATLDLPTRVKRVLETHGLTTVQAVREAPDKTLLSLPDLGPASVKLLRETLGLPSSMGVRPKS